MLQDHQLQLQQSQQPVVQMTQSQQLQQQLQQQQLQQQQMQQQQQLMQQQQQQHLQQVLLQQQSQQGMQQQHKQQSPHLQVHQPPQSNLQPQLFPLQQQHLRSASQNKLPSAVLNTMAGGTTSLSSAGLAQNVASSTASDPASAVPATKAASSSDAVGDTSDVPLGDDALRFTRSTGDLGLSNFHSMMFYNLMNTAGSLSVATPSNSGLAAPARTSSSDFGILATASLGGFPTNSMGTSVVRGVSREFPVGRSPTVSSANFYGLPMQRGCGPAIAVLAVADQAIVECNMRFLELTGLTADMLPSTTFHDVVATTDLIANDSYIADLVTRRQHMMVTTLHFQSRLFGGLAITTLYIGCGSGASSDALECIMVVIMLPSDSAAAGSLPYGSTPPAYHSSLTDDFDQVLRPSSSSTNVAWLPPNSSTSPSMGGGAGHGGL